MAVHDKKVSKTAQVGRKEFLVSIITAVSLADVVAWSFVPGYPFEIVAAVGYTRVEAGVVTADVKIGTVSALAAAIAFATATRVDGVLSSTLANIRGSKTDAINVHFTTDAAGVLTNGFVLLIIRPMPQNEDAGTE